MESLVATYPSAAVTLLYGLLLGIVGIGSIGLNMLRKSWQEQKDADQRILAALQDNRIRFVKLEARVESVEHALWGKREE